MLTICWDFDMLFVCFLWQNISDVLTEMRDQFYVNRSLTILSTQLRFTSQYVNYSHLQLIEVLFNMANVYQSPPIRVCLKYVCADLIQFDLIAALATLLGFYDFRQHQTVKITRHGIISYVHLTVCVEVQGVCPLVKIHITM